MALAKFPGLLGLSLGLAGMCKIFAASVCFSRDEKLFLFRHPAVCRAGNASRAERFKLETMNLTPLQLHRVTEDLGLDVPFTKGVDKPIKNCWHFSTDGNAVDMMFYDEDDFRAGMNRVYIVARVYNAIILAFSLMDTHFSGYDYPWSSRPLYFRRKGYWSSPRWLNNISERSMTFRQRRKVLRTSQDVSAPMIDGIVFPGEYVAYEIVEQIFRSHKAYLFFMCRSKESDVDSRGGTISRLSIPIQEMLQYRNEICRELFGRNGIRHLNTAQRLRLAKTLRARYNSSLKQVVRLSGLVYDEVKDYLK